jgi:hypothetical protein
LIRRFRMRISSKKAPAKILALALTLAMLMGMATVASAALPSDAVGDWGGEGITTMVAPRYPDVVGHWGRSAIEKWSNYDVLHGNDLGTFDPDGELDVTQLAQILVNTFGYTESYTGSLSGYSSTWGEDVVRKAVAAGAIEAGEAALPLTRELAAKIVAKAFGISPVSGASKFSDDYAISSEYKPYAAAVGRAGIFNGNDYGELMPADAFSRAQIMQALDNAVTDIVKENKAAESAKSVILNKGGVTLSEGTIDGDLIIAQGVGDGDITLDGVTVNGRLVIFGGGANSIHINGKSSIANVTIAKTFGQAARFVVESADATVGTVTIIAESKATVATTNGAEIAKIEVAPATEVSATGEVAAAEVTAATTVTISAKAAEVEIAAENAALTISSGATITSLTVETKAAVTVASGATVTAATIEASDVKLSGAGKVTAVTVTEDAKTGVEVKTSGTKVTVDADAGSVTTSTGKVDAGKSSTTSNSTTNSGNDIVAGGGTTYPKATTKFTRSTNEELPNQNGGWSIKSAEQSGANAYKITLEGTLEAQVWNDNYKSGAFADSYLGDGVKENKTGFFGYVVFDGLLPAGEKTTLVTANPAHAALMTTDAIAAKNKDSSPNAYHEDGKYHVTVDLTSEPADWLSYVLWSGATEITTVVTNGADTPYTLTIDYSELKYSYTAADNVNVAENTTLDVPAGSTVTIPNGKKLTVAGTLNVIGTNAVTVASGGTIEFTTDSTVKLTGTGNVVVKDGGALVAYNDNAGTFWPAESNATIVYEPGATATLSGTQFIGTAGKVSFSEGTIIQSKKKFTLAADGIATIATSQTFIVAPDDDLVINGTLTVAGTLVAYPDSEITVNGILNVTEDGTVTAQGAGNLVISAGGTLDVGTNEKAVALFNGFAKATALDAGAGVVHTQATTNATFTLCANAKIIRETNAAAAMNSALPDDSGYAFEESESTGVYTLKYTAPSQTS